MTDDGVDRAAATRATELFAWHARGRTLEMQVEASGEGPPVLLLPALQRGSTRAEMGFLARHLGRHHHTVCVDWPGFGAAAWPRMRWQPELYRAFLADLCEHLFDGPVAVVAVGHAAGYVLQVARQRPAAWARIVLIAPTWRGPLPAALDDRLPLSAALPRLLTLPGLGQHTRFAGAAFATGALDPVRSRAEFLELADQVLVPLLVLGGTETPPRAWEEMLELSRRPTVTFVRVPGGLALHRENPVPVARAVTDFLAAGKWGKDGRP